MESYTLKRRSCHARPEEQLKRAITFDPMLGSCSKFYSSFRRLFSLKYLWNPISGREGLVAPDRNNSLKGP